MRKTSFVGKTAATAKKTPSRAWGRGSLKLKKGTSFQMTSERRYHQYRAFAGLLGELENQKLKGRVREITTANAKKDTVCQMMKKLRKAKLSEFQLPKPTLESEVKRETRLFKKANTALGSQGEPAQIVENDAFPRIKRDYEKVKETMERKMENPEGRNRVEKALMFSNSKDANSVFRTIFEEAARLEDVPFKINSDEFHSLHKREYLFFRDLDECKEAGYFDPFVFDSEKGGVTRFNTKELRAIIWAMKKSDDYETIPELMTQIVQAIGDPEQSESVKHECLRVFKDTVILSVYHQAVQKTLYMNPGHTEALARALLALDPKNSEAHAMLGVSNYMRERACELVLRDKVRPEDKKYFEFCFNNVSPDSLSEKTIEDMRKKSLYASRKYYATAFETSYVTPQYSLRMLHRSITNFMFTSTPEERLDLITKDALMTYFAAKIHGHTITTNFAVVRAGLESSYVISALGGRLGSEVSLAKSAEKDLVILEGRILELCRDTGTPENVSSTAENAFNSLKHLKRSIKREVSIDEAYSKRIEGMIQKLQYLIEPDRIENMYPNRNMLGEIYATIARARKNQSSLSQHVYSARGVERVYVVGAFGLGGQVPTHSISRTDINLSRQIIEDNPITDYFTGSDREKVVAALERDGLPESTKLMDITDVGQFNSIMDVLIRTWFRTDELDLEHFHSKGHKSFEKEVKNSQINAGVKGDEDIRKSRKYIRDSTTNVMTSLLMRLGDCRQFAQVKALLFNTWQMSHLNKASDALQAALESSTGVNDSAIRTARKTIDKFSGLEMVTMDSSVYVGIETENVNEVYSPRVQDEEGFPFCRKDGELTKIEEHTLSVLVERDRLTLCDAFYHDVYPLDKGELKSVVHGDHSKKISKNEGYDVSGVIFQAGTIKARDEHGNFVDTPLFLVPTGFAGPSHTRIGRDEHTPTDGLHHIGNPVPTPKTPKQFLRVSEQLKGFCKPS